MARTRTAARAAAMALALLLATSGNDGAAQCDFDAPAKARKFSTSLVRVMYSCPPISPPFPIGNTVTQAGTPGCAPPVPWSPFLFDAKGTCQVKVSAKVQNPCVSGTPGPCSNRTIKIKCSGITTADGLTLISGPGWQLALAERTTLADDGGLGSGNTDMTIIDHRSRWALPPGAKGKLRATFVNADVSSCSPAGGCILNLPTCTNTEVLGIQLLDPAGRPFATIGSSTR